MTAMKAVQANFQTDYHEYDKWFTVAKVLLTLAPFIALIYLQAFIGGSNLIICFAFRLIESPFSVC